MKYSLLYNTDAWILCSILFVLMVGMVYFGLLLRHKAITRAEGLGPVEASLFGLLALMLAFTFGEAFPVQRIGCFKNLYRRRQGGIQRINIYPFDLGKRYWLI